MQQFHEKITGIIERFVFKSTENSFSVFKLQLNSKSSITVKCNLPNLQPGQEVQLKGNWIFHPKFGKQFEAHECVSTLPSTLVGLKKYLSSGLIKGIGSSYADKLVNYFGKNILTIINEKPERLQEVPGIGKKRVEKITKAWEEQKEIANIMVFLQERDISSSLAAKIYKKYRHKSIATLQENPYKLADEIWGVGFKTADEIAQKLGFKFDSVQRVTSGIIYVITVATQYGHLYVELEDLKEKTLTLLTLNRDEHLDVIKKALHILYDKDKIKLISEPNSQDIKNIKHFITLSSYYFTEISVAEKIKKLINAKSSLNFDTDAVYNQLRAPKSSNTLELIELNEDQQLGIINCLKNKVTIVTGGPGTGKTTIIKQLISVLDEKSVNYKLAAPTGRAAKRILESTGKFATTIHRLLEFDVSTMNFVHNESNALKTDYLIIDEASMIDIFLFNSILKALPINAHLVLIGDIDQLPSVGPGNILNDLIASKKTGCVRLTQIFRQAQDSLIVVNAHKINKGEFPITSTTKQANSNNSNLNSNNNPKLSLKNNNFIFIKEENPEALTEHLKKILFITVKKYNIDHNNTIVLTPMNRGAAGTMNLNHILQNLLNPVNSSSNYSSISKSSPHVSYRGTNFKINDRVMQIRNNYDKKVFNGDIGTIEDINLVEKEIKVNYANRTVEYDFDELNELVLAYAISIHKSQGSEYSAVIIPLFMQHFMLLQKNLIYTALTRAKKLCIFIGQTKALAIALRNTKGLDRLTFLQKFLTQESSTKN